MKEITQIIIFGIVTTVFTFLLYIGGIAAVIYAAVWILRHFGVL